MDEIQSLSDAALAGTYGPLPQPTVPIGSMAYEPAFWDGQRWLQPSDVPSPEIRVQVSSRELHDNDGLTNPVIAELTQTCGRLPECGGCSPRECVRPEKPFTSINNSYG